jgi:hypothetical protein
MSRWLRDFDRQPPFGGHPKELNVKKKGKFVSAPTAR